MSEVITSREQGYALQYFRTLYASRVGVVQFGDPEAEDWRWRLLCALMHRVTPYGTLHPQSSVTSSLYSKKSALHVGTHEVGRLIQANEMCG